MFLRLIILLFRELFPVLGGLKSNGNINMNSNWVNNNNNNNNTTTRRTNSPSIINEKFPALKPTKNFVNPNSQPIRYTTILKPQPKKAILMNISQTSNSDYTPNYLNNINNRTSSSSSSLPSMPILGNGSSSGAEEEEEEDLLVVAVPHLHHLETVQVQH